MKNQIKLLSFIFLVTISVMNAQQKQKNILFIGVDDLRPELNVYGKSHIKSPNIDALAKQGITFDNAYCNVPVCGASRASMFSGLRPNHSRFLNVESRIDKDAPGTITIPGWFKQHGYLSMSNGKMIHGGGDHEEDWSKPTWHDDITRANPKGYAGDENLELVASNPKKKIGKSTEAANVSDDAYGDGQVLKKSIKDMDEAVKAGKPFFLAVGFRKPHLPFAAPKKYWDLYNRANLPLSLAPKMPKDVPKPAYHTWGELRAFTDIPRDNTITDLGEAKTRELIHGYSACVSYVDHLIGDLLAHLDKIGQRDNTIIVLWSDHGWSLGDHELWCKHSTFDVTLKIPLIVSAPGIVKGERSKAVVELVDLYPTLCDLAGIDKPAHLQGDSFMSVLKNPNTTLADNSAIIRWKNSDVIKTPDYLYTAWRNQDGAYYTDMLFDHKNDKLETVNIAENPAYKQLVEDFRKKLSSHFEKIDTASPSTSAEESE